MRGGRSHNQKAAAGKRIKASKKLAISPSTISPWNNKRKLTLDNIFYAGSNSLLMIHGIG